MDIKLKFVDFLNDKKINENIEEYSRSEMEDISHRNVNGVNNTLDKEKEIILEKIETLKNELIDFYGKIQDTEGLLYRKHIAGLINKLNYTKTFKK